MYGMKGSSTTTSFHSQKQFEIESRPNFKIKSIKFLGDCFYDLWGVTDFLKRTHRHNFKTLKTFR